MAATSALICEAQVSAYALLKRRQYGLKGSCPESKSLCRLFGAILALEVQDRASHCTVEIPDGTGTSTFPNTPPGPSTEDCSFTLSAASPASDCESVTLSAL